jgi:transcriptional antiterminator NusG
MAKGWYVLHVYSGFENKIEKIIRLMLETSELDKDVVFDVKVPSEEVVDVRDGKRRVMNKKFLPGYILLEMDLPDETWKVTCSAIRKIQGVTGFVGTPAQKKPQPITQDEAKVILQKSGEIKGDKSLKPRQSFSVGESVKIVDGPFDSFTGTIEEIQQEKSKLKVMVPIFGRATPVEVDMLQVEKI